MTTSAIVSQLHPLIAPHDTRASRAEFWEYDGELVRYAGVPVVQLYRWAMFNYCVARVTRRRLLEEDEGTSSSGDLYDALCEIMPDALAG